MYTLLYGALKNMGDYLIYERSKQLLCQHKGMEDSTACWNPWTRI